MDGFESRFSASTDLLQQVRDAQAVAFTRAMALRPAEFSGRLDAYSKATFGHAWDHKWAEKQAINRLVSGYLVAPNVPADVAQVLALHAATFPNHAMNVELYSTIAERLVGGGDVGEGTALARAGLRNCAHHPDVSRLQDRVRRIYRKHLGEVGVPMDFAGPTLRGSQFRLHTLQGRPVLVVFWATTQSTSSEFLASCVSLARRRSATELEVVGVSLDSDLQDLTSWETSQSIPCRHVFSAEAGHAGLQNLIARFYGVESLPAFFLLDRQGIVVARGSDGFHVVERELGRLLNPRLALSDR